MMLSEYIPILGGVTAVVGAGAAFWANRKRPNVDDATANKIKQEILKDQQDAAVVKAAADAKRDRHIVRLEDWGFKQVRPWGRRATVIVEEQNDLLAKLARLAEIPYEPKHMEPFPEMPQIDGS